MRTLGILTIAVGLLSVSVAACSADSSGESIPDPASSENKKRSAEESPAPETPASPTAETTPTEPDASNTNGTKDGDETDIDCGGTKAQGCVDGDTCQINGDCVNNVCSDGTCKPPKVATAYCAQLSSSGCCNTLASTVEKFACIGIQLAGKEIACQGELALCGIGGIGGTPCGNLNKCCDKMTTKGLTKDAKECRAHNTGTASVCSTWLSHYKGLGKCD